MTRQDPYRPSRLAAACAAMFMLAAGAARASDGEPAAATAAATPPALQLIVSLADQRIDVWRGLELVEQGPVSSGSKGRETPAGIYSVLQKRKWHRSNLYSSAPMPHMQRITWSGMALHAGRLPGYPASHGCIRLDPAFARNLYQATRVGADVIVAPGATAPRPIAHALLQSLSAPMHDTQTRVASIAGIDAGIEIAASEAASLAAPEPAVGFGRAPSSDAPLRILITWRNGRERLIDVQSLLAELGYKPGEADGYMGPATSGAIRAFQTGAGLPPTGAASEELVDAIYRAAGRDRIHGHLYVRREQTALFDVPVLIADPATPLGTHMMTALPGQAAAPAAAWTAISLAGAAAPPAEAVLDRVTLSATTRRRLSSLLTPGSTIIVSDQGIGRETGNGTDFIVQLR